MGKIGLYVFEPYLYIILRLGICLVIFRLITKLIKGSNKNQVKNIDKSIYYRDIPCFGSIDLAYWLLYNFSNIKKNDLNNGLLGAYLLNWYKQGYIDIQSSKKRGFNNNFDIDLKDGNWSKSYVETIIYDFLKTVAGNNNILEKNEIRNYCSVDGQKFKLEYMFRNILESIQKDLEGKNHITVIKPKNYILFKTQEKIILSDELINQYQNLNGLKNFLLDYSNMEEKMHIEVHIWENYLIFANLLGIADKVKQQFNKIYPNFNVTSSMIDVSFDNTIVGHVYRIIKWKFNFLVATILLVIIFSFKNTINIIVPLLKISPFIIIAGILYWLLRKYLINKKVKEMNATTYAKITKVDVHYSTEIDNETNKYVTTKSYSFTYEYNVDGTYYTGYGYSRFKKRERQKIKIYYNEMKPQKSETAQKHNYYLKLFIFYIVIIIAIFVAIYGNN